MAKKIVLFADGTGNAFSEQQESNIWRLFDALDTSKKDQIAIYVEGVGTSPFRAWAIFDGITGVGAPSNIRKLYEFLCWNWEKGKKGENGQKDEPDDEIYMFGFSRGAFTIRALIELIKNEGLVPCKTKDGKDVSLAEMERNVAAAYRTYRKKTVPWATVGLPVVGRLIRDSALWLWHAFCRHEPYKHVVKKINKQGRCGDQIEIKFVGLFDTVEAFGVPLEELRSAIDKIVWPISFPIDEMSGKVRRVRHALALDDERTTFHPIRIRQAKPSVVKSGWLSKLPAWVRAGRATPAVEAQEGPAPGWEAQRDSESFDHRIKEVWFAGVHSDVGGGYPDDQLAHIPLVWMMEEIQKTDKEYAETHGREDDKDNPGLRFRPNALEDFRSASSPFGTLHDSRAGLYFFYRYSPRKIEKLDGNKVVVHHTVVKRILSGSDNYAPITLPHDAQVLGSDGKEQKLLKYIGSRASVEAEDSEAYRLRREQIFDKVWMRQLSYFSVLGLLLLLLALPLWEGMIDKRRVTSELAHVLDDGATAIFGGVIGLLKPVTPSYLSPYLNSFHDYPLIVIILALCAGVGLIASNIYRDKIRDLSREIWKPSNGNTQLRPRRGVGESSFRVIRILREIQQRSREIKPAEAVGMATVIGGFMFMGFVVVAVSSRLVFDAKLGSGLVCNQEKPDKEEKKALKWLGSDESVSSDEQEPFQTSDPCWASGLAVEKGVAYRLRIDIVKPWFDRDIMTDVQGFESDGALRKILKTPFLRWPTEGWFQPIARIGATGDVEWPVKANDGSGPIPSDAAGCKQMPKSYFDTREFCQAHQQDYRSQLCGYERGVREAEMGTSYFFASRPLSGDDLTAAQKAWANHDGEWVAPNGAVIACRSSYPRRTLVSDFVAPKTGQLFLFVNDALPLAFLPDDTHYQNNSGTAKITLTRAPLAPSGGLFAKQ